MSFYFPPVNHFSTINLPPNTDIRSGFWSYKNSIDLSEWRSTIEQFDSDYSVLNNTKYLTSYYQHVHFRGIRVFHVIKPSEVCIHI